MISSNIAQPVQVDVVIPVLDNAIGVAACVDAVRRQRGVAARILVVDNGSSDDSVAEATRHGAIVLVEERRSSYAARNRGIAAATAPVIAFTDSDCLPAADWLEQGLHEMDASGLDLCAGRVRLTAARTLPGRHDQLTYLDQERHVAAGFAATANLFVRRAALDSIGAFDHRLQSGGDLELTRRAVAAGLVLGYAHGAVVEHPPREGWRPVLRKAWRISIGHGQLAAEAGHLRTLHPRAVRVNEAVVASRDPSLVAVDVLVQAVAYAGRLRGYASRRLAPSARGAR